MTGTWCCIVIGTAVLLPAVGPLFHPLWVRSFALWLLLFPAVGPLFSPAVGTLFSPTVGPLFSPRSPFAESADFAQVLVGAAAVMFVHHALRDVLMAFHELLGLRTVRPCRPAHAPLRAARGPLD